MKRIRFTEEQIRYMAAARCPPRSDPQNSHDFRPRAIPLNPPSAALFERAYATVLKE